MYKLLWNRVKNIDTHIDRRSLFLFMLIVLNAVIGLLLWLVIGRLYLPQMD